MKDLITPIRTQLEEKMHLQCAVFVTIGSPIESPRYLNYGSVSEDRKILTIQSTQTSHIWFTVDLPKGYPRLTVEEFWHQFKEFRTQFLEANYPTISRT